MTQSLSLTSAPELTTENQPAIILLLCFLTAMAEMDV